MKIGPSCQAASSATGSCAPSRVIWASMKKHSSASTILPAPNIRPRLRALADDNLLLDTELPAGETRHFSANRQFEVTAGDSSAVLLELNGKAMPPLGSPGASGTMVLSQKDLRP